MEYNQIPQKIIDLQKLSFNSWYNAVIAVQEQTVSTMDSMLNQTTWIPEDGRNAMQTWMKIYRDERNRFKSYIDDSFAALEKSLREVRKPASAQKTAQKTEQAASQA
jgi:hypothetical protein